uniref:Uncharacterized protein n=1 Tax=Sphaerodactylus townsendi TaxID=933632 RepID=A0ACB8F545_9SAUR
MIEGSCQACKMIKLALSNSAFLAFLYLIRIDVTEVQIFIIIMHLLAMIGGPTFWHTMVNLFILCITCKIYIYIYISLNCHFKHFVIQLEEYHINFIGKSYHFPVE